MSSIIENHLCFSSINFHHILKPFKFIFEIIQCCISHIMNVFLWQSQCLSAILSKYTSIILCILYSLFHLIFFISYNYRKNFFIFLIYFLNLHLLCFTARQPVASATLVA